MSRKQTKKSHVITNKQKKPKFLLFGFVLLSLLVLVAVAAFAYGNWSIAKTSSTLKASASQWTLIKANPDSASVYGCYKDKSEYFYEIRLLFVRNRLEETGPDGKSRAWLPTTRLDIVENRTTMSGHRVSAEQLAWYQTVSMMAAYAPPGGGISTNFSPDYISPTVLKSCPEGVN